MTLCCCRRRIRFSFFAEWAVACGGAGLLEASGLGLAALLIYRCSAVFPAVLLLTALAAHEVHRPYWSYHYCTLCRAFELDFGEGTAGRTGFRLFRG